MPNSPPTFKPARVQAPTYGYTESGRHKDANQIEAKKVYNSARWKRLRALVLARSPLCSDVYGEHARSGQAVLAQHVDHVQPLRLRPYMAYVEENLSSLCVSCHSRKTKAERTERD